jgi:hypothetical protein
MRKAVLLSLLIFFFASLAGAQVPTSGNIFVGYTYLNTNLSQHSSGLNGWEGSIEGKFFPFVGIVGDFSANYGSLNFTGPGVTCPTTGCPTNINTHIDNFLFGPRVSAPVGKFRPFAELLFGASHANTNGFGSDTSFATAVGGGIDYKFFHLLGVRFEGDYIHTDLFNRSQGNFRFSTGLAFHF